MTMMLQNQTHVGFILLGFSELPHLRLHLFSFILGAYLLCLIGNIVIFILISSQPQLHSPMYLFMANLAIVDICLTSITFPRTLYSLLSGDLHISIHGCFTQLFLFHSVGNMDSFLLAIMAFDRYAAVCFPLRYLVIMNIRTCVCILGLSWVIVILHSTFYTILVSSRSYCSWVINHHFCDLPVIKLLYCSNFSEKEQMAIHIESASVIFIPVLIILGSYVLIIKAVLKLHSTQGRWRTFSTCSSHLTMVIMFYSSIIFMYFRPRSLYSPTYDRVISIIYCLINPTLNPFIYSLRNKEIKAAVRKNIKNKLHLYDIDLPPPVPDTGDTQYNTEPTWYTPTIVTQGRPAYTGDPQYKTAPTSYTPITVTQGRPADTGDPQYKTDHTCYNPSTVTQGRHW